LKRGFLGPNVTGITKMGPDLVAPLMLGARTSRPQPAQAASVAGRKGRRSSKRGSPHAELFCRFGQIGFLRVEMTSPVAEIAFRCVEITYLPAEIVFLRVEMIFLPAEIVFLPVGITFPVLENTAKSAEAGFPRKMWHFDSPSTDPLAVHPGSGLDREA